MEQFGRMPLKQAPDFDLPLCPSKGSCGENEELEALEAIGAKLEISDRAEGGDRGQSSNDGAVGR